jgi:Flp pilus assembly pilin Flp
MTRLNHFRSTMRRALLGERGQSLVEYSLIIALISVAAVGTLTTLHGGVGIFYSTIVTALNAAF